MNMGIDWLHLCDSEFNMPSSHAEAVCQEIISRKLGGQVHWYAYLAPQPFSPNLAALMKEAGLWMISFGLESGNNDILKGMCKNVSVEQSRTAVSMAHQSGIKTSGHFILGLPGETEKTMRQSLALALELPLDIAQFYAAAPFPGTGLYEEALKRGWLSEGSTFSQSRAVMDLPGLPAQRVDEFRRYAYRRFYMRPGTLLGLFSMLEPAAIKNMALNLRRFFQWTALH